jgi:hypothetical protein
MSERSATPPPSEAVLLARQERWAQLRKGYAPTRKSNRKNVTTTSTVPSFLNGTRRPPPEGLAFTLGASREARRQALFILDMLVAEEDLRALQDKEDEENECIDYLEEELEEEIVERPAAKRLKIEEPQ